MTVSIDDQQEYVPHLASAGGTRPPNDPPPIQRPVIIDASARFRPDGKILTPVEQQRIRTGLVDAARNALQMIGKMPAERGHRRHPQLIAAFDAAINQNIRSLERFAVLPTCETMETAKQHVAQQRAIEKKHLAQEHKAARKQLADELRSARQRLKMLELKIAQADIQASNIFKETLRGYAAQLRSARNRTRAKCNILQQRSQSFSSNLPSQCSAAGYPNVPPPEYIPSEDALELPEVPGIYFLFKNDIVEYVGQSINLAQRLRLGTHERLREYHRIAILCFEPSLLTWAECHYIGATKPMLNGGKHGSHNRYK